jgi:hypothetical protein
MLAAVAVAAVVRSGLDVVPARARLRPERRLGAIALAQLLFADLGRWRRELATLDKNLPRGLLYKQRREVPLSEWIRSTGFSAAT